MCKNKVPSSLKGRSLQYLSWSLATMPGKCDLRVACPAVSPSSPSHFFLLPRITKRYLVSHYSETFSVP